jgi:hypothetical protein
MAGRIMRGRFRPCQAVELIANPADRGASCLETTRWNAC